MSYTHQSRGFDSESRIAANNMSPVLPLISLLEFWAAVLLYFTSQYFFLAGGGLVSALSVVEVVVVELLSVAYYKPSRDILSLIAITYVAIRYIFSFESWIKKRCSV